ncbi:MAG: S-layer homology domain-containing protein [bacterium]|nr:S-layer homology domain-containing protein [bacterium]
MNILRKATASVSALALLLSILITPGMGFNVAQAAVDPADQPFVDFLLDDLGVSATALPDGAMSRYDVCNILWLADGEPTDAPDSGLSDVNSAQQEAVNHCVDMAYFEGTADARFDGSRTITREEVGKPVMNFLGEDKLSQADADIVGDMFYDWGTVDTNPTGDRGLDRYLAGLVDMGVVKGFPDGNVRPKDGIIGPHFASIYTKTLIDPADNVALRNGGASASEYVCVAEGGTLEDCFGSSPGPSPVGGALQFIDRGNPGPSIVADGAIVTPLELEIRNNSSAETQITQIDVRLTGIANDNMLDGAFFIMPDGSFSLNRRSTFSEGLAEVAVDMRIPGNSSLITTLAINVDEDFNSGTIGFQVESVVSNASSVTGLPIQSQTVQVVDGANTIGSLAVDVNVRNATTATVEVGERFVATEFELTAGSNEDVMVYSMFLNDEGSIQDGDLEDAELTLKQTGETLASCEFRGSDLFCGFEEGLLIREGENLDVLLWVTVALTSDAATRTISYTIDENFHVDARGVASGQRFLVGPGSTDTSFPIGDGGVNVHEVLEGSMTLSKDPSSPTGDISPGADNVAVATFRTEVFGESVRIEKAAIDLSAGTLTADDISGTVRLFLHEIGSDPTSGKSVLSRDAGQADLFSGTPSLENTTNVTIEPGTPMALTIVLTLKSTAVPNRTLTPALNIQFERVNSNSTDPTGAVSGNSLTVKLTTIKVSSNTSFTNTTLVAGAPNTKIASFTFQAGNDESQLISAIDLSINNVVGITNMRLRRADLDGEPQMGTTKGTISETSNTFSPNTTVGTVEQGATAIIDVYVDMQTTATGTYTVTVKLDGVNFTGSTSSTSRSLPSPALALQTVTAAGSEDLVVTSVTQPTKGVAHAGMLGREMMKFKLEPNFGGVNIQEFRFFVDNGGGNTKNWTLKKSDGTVLVTGVTITNGILNFPVSITLEKDVEVTYILTADFTDSGDMNSQQNVSITIAGIESDGAASGSTIFEIYPGGVNSFTSSTSSEGSFRDDRDLVMVDSGGATGDPMYLATADFDFQSDMTASPSLNGASTSITAGQQVSEFGYDNQETLTTSRLIPAAATTGNANEDFVLGELVYVFDASGPTGGIAMVETALSNAIVGSILSVFFEGSTTATAVTLTASDVVVHLATPVAADESIALPGTTCGFNVTNGQVAFLVDVSTGANTGLTVIDATVASGADCTGALTGVTLANTDGLAVYSAQQFEAPSATGQFAYTTGQIVVVADDSTPANSGLHIVNSTRMPGETLLGAAVPFDSLTLTASDRIAVIGSLPVAGEPVQVQDSFPQLSTVSSGFGTLVTQSEQLVAKLKITNPGPRQLSIKSFKFKCTGSWAAQAAVLDNAIRVERNGATTLSVTRSDAGAEDCNTADVTVTLNTPEVVSSSGGTLELWLYFDTAGGTGTNQFFQVEFNQTAGQAGSCVTSYFYTQASGGPGGAPTSSSPAQICNDNKLFGPSFES